MVPPVVGPQLGANVTFIYESAGFCKINPLDVKSCWLLLTSIEKLPVSVGLTGQIAFEDVNQVPCNAFFVRPTLQNKLWCANPVPITVT